jgi:hypothetical protein
MRCIARGWGEFFAGFMEGGDFYLRLFLWVLSKQLIAAGFRPLSAAGFKPLSVAGFEPLSRRAGEGLG